MEMWDGSIRPGRFWAEDIESVQLEMLEQGRAPSVTMSGLHKKTALRLRLSQTESCFVRELPENFHKLSRFAAILGVPYRGNGAASFAFNTICDLLRRKNAPGGGWYIKNVDPGY